MHRQRSGQLLGGEVPVSPQGFHGPQLGPGEAVLLFHVGGIGFQGSYDPAEALHDRGGVPGWLTPCGTAPARPAKPGPSVTYALRLLLNVAPVRATVVSELTPVALTGCHDHAGALGHRHHRPPLGPS